MAPLGSSRPSILYTTSCGTGTAGDYVSGATTSAVSSQAILHIQTDNRCSNGHCRMVLVTMLLTGQGAMSMRRGACVEPNAYTCPARADTANRIRSCWLLM